PLTLFSLPSLLLSSSFSFTTSPPPLLSPLSLHDALPISSLLLFCKNTVFQADRHLASLKEAGGRPEFTFYLFQQLIKWNIVVQIDRKSTRLNSSHVSISYAVFCLKKKRKQLNRSDI